jgi:HSP20 family protein
MSQPWDPLQDLMVLQDRMNRLFEDATQRHTRGETEQGDGFESADWVPAADIYETESNYVIVMDLPGIDRSTLEINVDDESRLLVKGTRLISEPQQHRCERPRGKFLRSFSIPGSVNNDEIGAEYKDGVLQILLPKRKEEKARVEIKIS